MEELIRVGIPSHHATEVPPIKLRFKVHPDYIVESLNSTINSIHQEMWEAYEEYLNLLDDSFGELFLDPPEPKQLSIPVAYTPIENVEFIAKLHSARRKFDTLNREYQFYRAYRDYVTSQDELLEIEPASTTFFVSAEELEEQLDTKEEEEEEDDIFAQADQRQRELALQYSEDENVIDPQALAEYVTKGE